MRRTLLAVTALLAMHLPARAVDARMARVLMKIDPDTRLEQVCDLAAMKRIGRETAYRPDRAKSDIITHPIHRGDRLEASGAAFRSNGKWYAFSFKCTGTADHLNVVAFSFKLGDPIAPSRWADLGLWR